MCVGVFYRRMCVLDMLCFIGECVYCICNVLWVNVGVGHVVLAMSLKSTCPRVPSSYCVGGCIYVGHAMSCG